MNFKESLNKLRNMSDEEIISNIERTTGKELVSYEGMDALIAALMGFYNGELKKKANTSHKHNKTEITDFPTSLKNPNALTISLNGTSQGAYDGSSAKSINVTASNVGTYTKSEIDNKISGTVVDNLTTNDGTKALSARQGKILNEGKADKSHTHDDRYYTESEMNSKLNTKLSLSGGTMTGSLVMSGNNTITTSYNCGIKGTKKDGSTEYIMYVDSGNNLHVGHASQFPIWCDGTLTVTGNIVTNGSITLGGYVITVEG